MFFVQISSSNPLIQRPADECPASSLARFNRALNSANSSRAFSRVLWRLMVSCAAPRPCRVDVLSLNEALQLDSLVQGDVVCKSCRDGTWMEVRRGHSGTIFDYVLPQPPQGPPPVLHDTPGFFDEIAFQIIVHQFLT